MSGFIRFYGGALADLLTSRRRASEWAAAKAPTAWQRKQEAAKPGRYYGGDGTIHGNSELDVEVDSYGRVVAVWFRCQMLPFQQVQVDKRRADEMRTAAGEGGLPALTGVELSD